MATHQGIMKRNPDVQLTDFNEAWEKHTPLLMPYFKHCGITQYTQIRGPLTSDDASLGLTDEHMAVEVDATPLLIAAVSGSPEAPQWLRDYSTEVIQPDEKKFVRPFAEGEPIKIVPLGKVSGTRVEVMKDGKILVDVPEKVTEVWESYAKRATE